MSADCSEPTQEGRLPAYIIASRRGRPGDLLMTPRTCCLSVLAHGVMSGRKNWQAWHTASISRQLMCRSDSSSDHRPKVGLPSHSAPQPLLEASVLTTFLLCSVSRITPCFSGGVRNAKPRMEPSASARNVWVACEADPTEVPVKPLP